MATTKPKGTKKTDDTDVRPETLAQFSALVDQHLNRRAGFGDMVVRLAVTRAQIKQVDAARTALFEQIKERRDNGLVAVPGTDFEVRQTAPGPATIVRKVTSAAVKKAAPEVWQRCHAPASYVQVKPPVAVRLTIPEVAVPSLGAAVDDATLVTTYKEHPAWARLKELRAEESELVESLDKLGADAGWDGLPVTFADGWVAGLRRMQFSAAKLEATEPEVFKALSVPDVKQSAARTYVGRLGADQPDAGADTGADGGAE